MPDHGTGVVTVSNIKWDIQSAYERLKSQTVFSVYFDLYQAPRFDGATH